MMRTGFGDEWWLGQAERRLRCLGERELREKERRESGRRNLASV
jgi:hypothetical protein